MRGDYQTVHACGETRKSVAPVSEWSATRTKSMAPVVRHVSL